MPFQKGVVHTHKPTGRPRGFRGLAKAIARETGDGQELIDFALKTFRNKKDRKMQWLAMEWLADRVWGRVPQVVHGDVAVTHSKLDLASLDADQRAQLRELLLAARPRTTEVPIDDETTLLPVGGDEP